jgi:hypothetical protein
MYVIWIFNDIVMVNPPFFYDLIRPMKIYAHAGKRTAKTDKTPFEVKIRTVSPTMKP